jgi:hypothetical protein
LFSLMPLGRTSAMAQSGPLEKRPEHRFYWRSSPAPAPHHDPLGLYKRRPERHIEKNCRLGLIRDKMISGDLMISLFYPLWPAMSWGWVAANPCERGHHSEQQRPGHHTEPENTRTGATPQWKGFVGVPPEHSMHNYLLRYYLAERA